MPKVEHYITVELGTRAADFATALQLMEGRAKITDIQFADDDQTVVEIEFQSDVERY